MVEYSRYLVQAALFIFGPMLAGCDFWGGSEGRSVQVPVDVDPEVTGLRSDYDTLNGVVRLAWNPAKAGTVREYLLFRMDDGALNMTSEPVGTSSAAAYVDSVFPGDRKLGEHFRDSLSKRFVYRVKIRGVSGDLLPGFADLSVLAPPPRLVRTYTTLSIAGGARDTLTPGDTLELRAGFRNPTRPLRSVAWHVRGASAPVKSETLVGAMLQVESAVKIDFPEVGEYAVIAAVEDAAGTVWRDSLSFLVIMDAPEADAGRDTVVRAGSTVALQGRATDRFGMIRAWEWKCGDAAGFSQSATGSIMVAAPAVEREGFPCVLRVTDDDGMIGMDTVLISTRYRFPTDKPHWELVGGNGVRNSWDLGEPVFEEIRVLHEWRGKLYAGLLTAAGAMKGQVWRYDGAAWEAIGGGGVRQSWQDGTVMSANALTSDDKYLYAGTGIHNGMARVWRFDGDEWEQIGGDGMRGGWGDELDCVWHLSMHKGEVYAGLVGEDVGVQRAPLYRFDGISWRLVAGLDNENGGWGENQGYMMNYISVSDGQSLYVGLAGREPGNGDVFRYDGSRFQQVGGDGLFGSWTNPDVQFVEDAIMHDNKLYISLNGTKTDSRRDNPIWMLDGSRWHPVGDVPPEWEGEDCWIYNKLFVFQGELYLGAGGNASATTMWKLDPQGRWVKIGGHGLHGSGWNTGSELDHTLWVYTITSFGNELYIGLSSAEKEGMAQVWRLGLKP